MIVILKQGVGTEIVESVAARIRELGLTPHVSRGEYRTIIGAIGEEQKILSQQLESLDGVERVVPIMRPYKLASREFHKEGSVVRVGGAAFGPGHISVIAGPCAVEDPDTLMETARAVQSAGAEVLRGGAFKPRTSPYSFQGLGEEGLKMLADVRKELNIPICTEVTNTRDVELVDRYTDVIQIGARSMQNFALLTEVGRTQKPILLKRGASAQVKEWLMSAEYILSQGNCQVILCERGIRSFETGVRFVLDVSAVPQVKQNSHLPVIVDPSHAAGKRDYVTALALAAIAAGADGLIVEVHAHPDRALCDGSQALTHEMFADLMAQIRNVAEAIGRKNITADNHE